MQGRESGVGPAALELDKQSFFGWAGEVPRTFEGTISATSALILLEEVEMTSSNYCQVPYVCNVKKLSYILPFTKKYCSWFFRTSRSQ